ncbi:signal recognition particle-docking protein FtsY [Acholeplasma equirhinis]|uniref:signal recognition particle-docking protein FtsY n=1 Tax=Acholeplasma equirhinis TaxID=555393 RepID=UPI00197ACA86|nr:signal recognition particle-docking protein FtsY [Acholeplasma equirhinis]MBN3490669.1 signal recognition particle-docking protein FtsY [Acholeplasma equirhinis]
MGFFANLFKKKPKNDKYQMGLHKSKASFDNLKKLIDESDSISEDLFDSIEDLLIAADIGVETVLYFTNALREEIKKQGIEDPHQLSEIIVDKLFEIYLKDEFVDTTLRFDDGKTNVYLFVGVNGVGKTTTIGKLAKQYKSEGKKVMMVAGDTFRAGAIEQLREWSNRAGVGFFAKDAGTDPSSVIFDALTIAVKENYDLVLVDTAGRLQNKVNLMNELAKMKRVISKTLPDSPQETLLVIDATTGQNGMNQAHIFNEVTELSGIVLTKLDGTAKGGIVLAIRHLYNLPIKYVGLGEKIDDLVPFDIENYIYNLFKGFF